MAAKGVPPPPPNSAKGMPPPPPTVAKATAKVPPPPPAPAAGASASAATYANLMANVTGQVPKASKAVVKAKAKTSSSGGRRHNVETIDTN